MTWSDWCVPFNEICPKALPTNMDIRASNREQVPVRPTELRYRIADFINDGFKAIPGLHEILKSLLLRLAARHRNISPQGTTSLSNPFVRRETSPGQDATAKGLAGRLDLLPFPPLEMRELVGPTELEAFDNPEGTLVYPWLPEEVYERVFDFGCGCGRVARQLILQRATPETYIGIDLHAGMIRWCQNNLHPIAPHFQFLHHDVFNVRFNPGSEKPRQAAFPAADSQFTLVNALSVFTHLTQDQAVYYLRECARILHADGLLHASWFLFDKADYPMLQESDNALYVSYLDPSAAVIFDRAWVRGTAHQFGLTIRKIIPPQVRGHQWLLIMSKKSDIAEPEFPPDTTHRASVPPPMGSRPDVDRIGLEEEV